MTLSLISAVPFRPHEQPTNDSVLLTISFDNAASYYILNIYIPGFIIMTIAYTTFCYPMEDFPSRIMVTLTCLLVQTTFFAQVIVLLDRLLF